jgi:hypothetical protein
MEAGMKHIALGLTGFVLLCAGSAVAHHSFSMFDSSKIVSMEGTVQAYEFRNPHIWVHMMAPDTEGKIYRWSLELGAPAQLTQRGWSKDTVAAGDKITITMHPLKDGSHGGQLLSLVLPSGKTLMNRREDFLNAPAQ